MPTKKLQIIGSIASNIIDDTSASTTATWSSDKINGVVSDLQTDIDTAQTDAKAAQASIDNLQIGGRNLITNTEAERTATREYIAYTDLTPIFDEHGVGEYMLSFDIKSADITNSDTASVYILKGDNTDTTTWYYYFSQVSIPVTTEYVRHSLAINVYKKNGDAEEADKSNLSFYGTYDTGNILYVKNLKLEKGNVATDWSPAFEDIGGGSEYELPAAGETLGGVKTGGDVTIADGVITVGRADVAASAAQAENALFAENANSSAYAEVATQDTSGNTITSYIKDVSVNQEDSSITITKGDSTTSVVKQPKKVISLFSDNPTSITNAGYGQFCFSSTSYTPYVYAPVVQYKITGYDGYGISIESTTNLASDLASAYLHYILDVDSNVVYSLSGSTARSIADCDLYVRGGSVTANYIPFTNTWAEYNSTHSYTLCLMAWKEISLPAAESASF